MSWSDDEREGLAALLDEIIPPGADGRMPGAGAVVSERIAVELEARPESLATVRTGLVALDRISHDEKGAAFVKLSRADRASVLADVAIAEPGLVPSLLFPTYVAYYEHPRVLTALGREPRPPHPAGYELEPFDASLLENVRRRPRLYREC